MIPLSYPQLRVLLETAGQVIAWTNLRQPAESPHSVLSSDLNRIPPGNRWAGACNSKVHKTHCFQSRSSLRNSKPLLTSNYFQLLLELTPAECSRRDMLHPIPSSLYQLHLCIQLSHLRKSVGQSAGIQFQNLYSAPRSSSHVGLQSVLSPPNMFIAPFYRLPFLHLACSSKEFRLALSASCTSTFGCLQSPTYLTILELRCLSSHQRSKKGSSTKICCLALDFSSSLKQIKARKS